MTGGTRTDWTSQRRRASAFTLIEVLVVVAIIALLLSILLPSLASARNLAKLTIDKANCKQIATMIATYQSESRGYVPLLFNYWSNADPDPTKRKAAENCWLSVALRRYDATNRSRLASKSDPSDPLYQFDATKPWTDATRMDYEAKYMPEFFACPFQREKAPVNPNPIAVYTSTYMELRYQGKWEAYNTWLHTAKDGFGTILKGTRLNSGADKEAWLSKFTTITFNKNGGHRKWEDIRRSPRGGASPSDWTAVYCGQGEFTPYPESNSSPSRRANVGSHKNNGVGGTNAVFADTHVEWIPGKNIGRP